MWPGTQKPTATSTSTGTVLTQPSLWTLFPNGPIYGTNTYIYAHIQGFKWSKGCFGNAACNAPTWSKRIRSSYVEPVARCNAVLRTPVVYVDRPNGYVAYTCFGAHGSFTPDMSDIFVLLSSVSGVTFGPLDGPCSTDRLGKLNKYYVDSCAFDTTMRFTSSDQTGDLEVHVLGTWRDITAFAGTVTLEGAPSWTLEASANVGLRTSTAPGRRDAGADPVSLSVPATFAASSFFTVNVAPVLGNAPVDDPVDILVFANDPSWVLYMYSVKVYVNTTVIKLPSSPAGLEVEASSSYDTPTATMGTLMSMDDVDIVFVDVFKAADTSPEADRTGLHFLFKLRVYLQPGVALGVHENAVFVEIPSFTTQPGHAFVSGSPKAQAYDYRDAVSRTWGAVRVGEIGVAGGITYPQHSAGGGAIMQNDALGVPTQLRHYGLVSLTTYPKENMGLVLSEASATSFQQIDTLPASAYALAVGGGSVTFTPGTLAPGAPLWGTAAASFALSAGAATDGFVAAVPLTVTTPEYAAERSISGPVFKRTTPVLAPSFERTNVVLRAT